MMFVDGKLAAWLIKELDMRGWSHRELAWRSDLSQTTVSDVISEKRPATWDFCAAVARAMGVSVNEVFVLAGLKPLSPPPWGRLVAWAPSGRTQLVVGGFTPASHDNNTLSLLRTHKDVMKRYLHAQPVFKVDLPVCVRRDSESDIATSRSS